MNNYIVRQKDIEVLMQSDKTLFYKLELLNKDMKTIDRIEGNLISDNISIDASSDVRRTYNCTMHISDSTFDVGYGKRFFYNRLIRPYIGVKHQRSGEILWYLLGTFIFVDTNFSFDTTNKTLSLTCNDLMCLLNGIMGGNLTNYKRMPYLPCHVFPVFTRVTAIPSARRSVSAEAIPTMSAIPTVLPVSAAVIANWFPPTESSISSTWVPPTAPSSPATSSFLPTRSSP